MKFKKDLDLQYSYEKIRNNKIVWFLILILSSVFFSLSFFPIPGLTTFHSYTLGILLGYYSPIFYISITLLSIFKICTTNFLRWKYFNFNFKVMFLLVLGIGLLLFVSFSIHFKKPLYIGKEIWKVNFNDWWNSLKQNNNFVWTPNTWNHGLIIIFIGCFISSLATIYTLLGISLLVIIFSLVYLFFPQKNKPKKIKVKKPKNKIKKETTQEEKNFKTFNVEKKSNISDNTEEMPFDDPFA